MKLIKKVIIGPYTFEINKEDRKVLAAGTATGMCYTDDLKIVIASDYPDQVTRDTLLHEILHAIHYTMDIRLDHEVEEHVIRKMATGLLMVLQDNPDLVKILTAKG